MTLKYVKTANDGLVHTMVMRARNDIVKWSLVTYCNRFCSFTADPAHYELATEIDGDAVVTCLRCVLNERIIPGAPLR